MTGIANQLRTKQGAIIGAGVIIVITAITIWSWKSTVPNKKDSQTSNERSVKNKKDIKEESVAKKQNDMASQQSQIKKNNDQESLIIKEKQVVVSVEKDEELPVEKKNEDVEKVVVTTTETVTEIIDTHCDESSSIKSHTLSAATSSADETDICTPQHEANTVTDVKRSESSATAQIDTQENISILSENKNVNEKVKFDWTEESVKAALPPINRDIVTVSTTSLDTAENDITVSNESITTTITESQQEEYVVVDHPKKDEFITEQAITTPATTEEEPVLSEKVQVSSSSEKSPISLSSSLTASAPEFVPKSHQQPKKPAKKFLTREQLIEQQRQHHMPRSKARCSHWPHCTNNNCKFFHPYRACRAGDDCLFGDRCMFVHPNDCTVNVRDTNKNAATVNATTATSISA
ncbi:hypothetical protein INT46_009532 [Mucor plumbeus]|uniref:C3H1-type domain-containing protein n=1 Tax=Mucor plumbeus TaxID=97098 RepID=A0A8H7RFH2_9FUNG|nr:hypothetical protein INT46_009532 [Mucor plumbeus]